MKRPDVRGGHDARRTGGRRIVRARRGVNAWTRLTVLVAAFLTVAGCAGFRRAENPFETEGDAARGLLIVVENRNFNEATLRAVARIQRRIGVVPGNGRQTFAIPWTSLDDLQIRIDILAGDRFTTNRVSVGPGETVRLTIQNPVYRSLLTK